MKTKHLTRSIFFSAMMLLIGTQGLFAQSTEGKDFWVTFLRADQATNNDKKFSLSFSAREACTVRIENPYSGYTKTVSVNANSMEDIDVFNGNDPTDRSADNAVCYSFNSEVTDTSALHITSDKAISVYATNYKKATFDATNVLPTDALLDGYMIQNYTPSDHGGDNDSQGSHFCIIATEDNTVVDYVPSVYTYGWKRNRDGYFGYSEFDGKQLGDTLTTPVLKKGQVWYVWTGMGVGEDADLSGTYVKARDGKKIAVFQGNPHTNLPYYGFYGLSSAVKERDHIFSQAMPTSYWGNTFALTSSMTRKRDIVRIMALNDGTEVRINGVLKHTFDFSKEKKQFWEFEIGEENVQGGEKEKELKSRPAPEVIGTSCFIETSCPCAVHMFITSRGWDAYYKDNSGDPAMIWINPIEQQIDKITFSTYDSDNGTSQHYVNVVTTADNTQNMKLDGVNKSSSFEDVAGSNGQYKFARLSLGSTAGAHTLEGDSDKGFIAHVYGLTENESYGYSAGGSTKILTQAITINGETFTPESENMICGKDTVIFTCELNYEFEDIKWYFGDGSPMVSGKDTVEHFYTTGGVYHAYALIQRYSSNVCVGQSKTDSIPIKVNIGKYEFEIGQPEDAPCKQEGVERTFRVPFTNVSGVNLTGKDVTIGFNEDALADGFTEEGLQITDGYFVIDIPDGAKAGVDYGIEIAIISDCGGADTTLYFGINYEADDILVQRFDDVIGITKAPFEGKTLSDFCWYKDSVLMPEQQNAVLDLRNTTDTVSEYYVCFTVNKGTDHELTNCSCPIRFKANAAEYNFKANSDSLVSISYTAGGNIFVNTEAEAEAQWIKIDGTTLSSTKLPEGGGLVETPQDEGLYILRVSTGKEQRNFKILIYKNK